MARKPALKRTERTRATDLGREAPEHLQASITQPNARRTFYMKKGQPAPKELGAYMNISRGSPGFLPSGPDKLYLDRRNPPKTKQKPK